MTLIVAQFGKGRASCYLKIPSTTPGSKKRHFGSTYVLVAMYSDALYDVNRISVCALIAGGQDPAFDRLRDVLRQVCSQTLQADSLADVGRILRSRRDISVIVSTPTLKDATWRDVANLTRFSPQTPMLILGVERADPATWSELLENGGFGLCASPWQPESVRSTIQAAFRRWLRTAQIAEARAENLRHIQAQRYAS